MSPRASREHHREASRRVRRDPRRQRTPRAPAPARQSDRHRDQRCGRAAIERHESRRARSALHRGQRRSARSDRPRRVTERAARGVRSKLDRARPARDRRCNRARNIDDTVGELPASPQLASPPLDLRGMPSAGPANARATIAVLCNPSTSASSCSAGAAATRRSSARPALRRCRARIVGVGAVLRRHARGCRRPRLSVGRRAVRREASAPRRRTSTARDFLAGLARWVESMLAESTVRHRRIAADQLLDKVADKLHVDKQAFATCRAAQAGSAIKWIEAARHAGVRTSPSTVVGGRIYPSITDGTSLQQLVGAEARARRLPRLPASGRRYDVPDLASGPDTARVP